MEYILLTGKSELSPIVKHNTTEQLKATLKTTGRDAIVHLGRGNFTMLNMKFSTKYPGS